MVGTAAGVGVVAVTVGSMRYLRYEALAGGGELELLNSEAITDAIRTFNPQGEFGARHVHTLPHRVISPFDPMNDDHQQITEFTTRVSE